MDLKALLSAASDRDKSLPAPARSPGLELHSAHVSGGGGGSSGMTKQKDCS